MSRDIEIPEEPIAVFLSTGDRVAELSSIAEAVARRYGQAEASGLREARYLQNMDTTLAMIAARSAEFVLLLDGMPSWERVLPESQ